MLPGGLQLLRGNTLVWRDTSKLFQPLRPLIVEALRNFELPLWNPHEAFGVPLFAQMLHGVLHPVSVLAAFLFPGAGLDSHLLLHLALAGGGAAALAGTLGASPAACAVAGLGYGLSGYVQGMTSVVQYLAASGAAPWTVAGILRAGQGRRLGGVSAALGVAVLCFAGDPEWVAVALALGLVLSAVGSGAGGFVRALAASALGLALAAVQWIPTLGYLGETARAVALDPVDRAQWALSPWRIAEFGAPGLFGSAGGGVARWPVYAAFGGLSRPWLEMPFAPSVYLGATILALAALGVRCSKNARWIAACSLVVLWLALGANGGAEQILHSVPIWGKFRYAEKLVGPLCLCVTLLAAYGADRLGGGLCRRHLAFASCAAAGALLVGLALRAASSEAAANLSAGLLHAAAALAVLGACLGGALRWPRTRQGLCWLVPCAVFLDLSSATGYALRGGKRGLADESILRSLRSIDGPVRIATPFEGSYHYPVGLDQYDAQVWGQSRMGVASYNCAVRVDQVNTYTGLRPRRLDTLLSALVATFGPQSTAALRRFALTHVVLKAPFTPDEERIAAASVAQGRAMPWALGGEFVPWEVPHRPWAAFAASVTSVSGEKAALRALLTALERGDPSVVVEGASVPSNLADGRVLNVERTPKRLRVEAASPGPGVLVVNEAFWPGWEATIDDSAVPIWPADFLVRAVPWPAGRHVLEMRYEPPEVRWGARVTLLGIVVALMICLVPGLGRVRGRWIRARLPQQE